MEPWPDEPDSAGHAGPDLDLDGDEDGFSEVEGDCDDADPALHPGAEEAANGIDDDCDGAVDEGPEHDDADADGYTPAAGDCDDEDAAVNPGAWDGCDELDNDCDGAWNEDAGADDPYETGSTDPYDLHDLTDAQWAASATLHWQDDADGFAFTCTDEGGLGDTFSDGFVIRGSLSDVPPGRDYVLELWRGNSLIQVSDDEGDEAIEHHGFVFFDDGGSYEIRVASHGAVDCATPYTLFVQMHNE